MLLDEFTTPGELLDSLISMAALLPTSYWDDDCVDDDVYERNFIDIMSDHRSWQCGDEWVPSDTDLARMKLIYRSLENASRSN